LPQIARQSQALLLRAIQENVFTILLASQALAPVLTPQVAIFARVKLLAANY
jgi:hypothetical protein